MVKTYCVRQRKMTESLPNSQRYVQTKNNRMLEKSICSECNSIKSRFVSNKQGSGGSPWVIDFKKGWKLLSDPGLWEPVNRMKPSDARKLVQYYKDQYQKAKRNGSSGSYNSYVKMKGWAK